MNRIPFKKIGDVTTLLVMAFALGFCLTANAEVYSVAAGDDLQETLDKAKFGDIIELEAGATFEGNFILRKSPRPENPRAPDHERNYWITIRTSAHDKLPTRGNRVKPADAQHMTRLVSPGSDPALTTEFSASRYQLLGLEITTTSKLNYNLVLLGHDGLSGKQATSTSQLPVNIVFERCYIHGNAKGQIRRGIALNGRSVSVLDCYLSDFHERGADSQAICGWNGPGPFKIVNNYLEGSGENIMFGGSDPTIRNLVPSDIEIRHNHFNKPRSWHKQDDSFAGTEWTVKNLLELKSARRVLIDGNILENCWAQGQSGFAILLTPRNQDREAPWCAVEDVTIQNNLIRNAGAGIQFLNQHIARNSENLDRLTPPMKRVLVRNNVMWNIDRSKNGGRGTMLLFSTQPNSIPSIGIVIENNTFIHGDRPHSFFVVGDDDKFAKNLIVRNNISTMGQYGIMGTAVEGGNPTVTKYFDGARIKGNVFISRTKLKDYPPGNYAASRVEDLAFRDVERGDFRLTAGSRYRNLGTDRLNPGIDHEAVAMALRGVVRGTMDPPATELPSSKSSETTSPGKNRPVQRPTPKSP